MKDLCKREGLYTHWVRFYISKSNSITEEKFLSLSYKQRKFLNTQITYELIGYDMLKLKHVLILTPWQMRGVKETGHYVLEFILKIKEVLNLTEEQLEILGHNSVYHVLEDKNTSWAELIDKKNRLT